MSRKTLQQQREDTIENGLDESSMLYVHSLGKNLRRRVLELSAERRSALSLSDELTLTRALVPDALASYEVACDMADALAVPDENGVVPLTVQARIQSLKLLASQVVHAACTQVKEMALAAKRVEDQGQLDVFAMQAMVFQVTKIIDLKLHDKREALLSVGIRPADLADEIANELSASVHIPGEVHGTDLTPDQDVIDMDATIPREPEPLEQRA